MRDLICEGSCNPTLPEFDAAATELYESRMRESRRQLVPPSLVEAQLLAVTTWRTTLRHTPHVQEWGHRWSCRVCGAERRYGTSFGYTAEGREGRWGRQTASQRAHRRTA